MTNKQRILNETYLLFAEYGEHFSLTQVANALGIKKQSLYNYFDKKDDLVFEMLSGEITKYYDEMDELFEKNSYLPVKKQIYHLGLSHICVNRDKNRVKARKALSSIMDDDYILTIKNNIIEQETRYEAILLQLLEQAADAGLIEGHDLEFMVCIFFTFVRGVIAGVMTSNPYDSRDEFYDKFFEKVWCMIAIDSEKK